ncbi:mCG148332 [Mus musculus]|nr:mCG148332 [Mus musculus]
MVRQPSLYYLKHTALGRQANCSHPTCRLQIFPSCVPFQSCSQQASA